MTPCLFSDECRVCQSEDSEEELATPDGLKYHHCNVCGYISLNRRFQPTFEDARKRYLLHENSLENSGYVAMLEDFIAKCVSPFVAASNDRKDEGNTHSNDPKTPRILDFGSGPTPVLAELLRRHGYEVDIYDLHFAPDTPYGSRTYDAITATEVLEHLAAPLETVMSLKERLNPAGILAVMTSFHSEDWDRFSTWTYRTDPTHISFFSERTMKHLAARAGMDILSIDDTNLCVFGNPD